MPLVSAFLVPGSPLPKLKPEIPTLGRLATAMQTAGRALAASRPEAVLVYSTQWIAVLDQLWLTRHHNAGVHVDEMYARNPIGAYPATGCPTAPSIGGFINPVIGHEVTVLGVKKLRDDIQMDVGIILCSLKTGHPCFSPIGRF